MAAPSLIFKSPKIQSEFFNRDLPVSIFCLPAPIESCHTVAGSKQGGQSISKFDNDTCSTRAVLLRLICVVLLSGVAQEGFSHPWQPEKNVKLNGDVVGRRSWLQQLTSFSGLLPIGLTRHPTIASAEESDY